MAGIGFELKKMFAKKGLLATLKAYGYASVVCIGPMILGILLLLGIRVIAGFGNATEFEKELLNSMVTYSLLFSMVLTNAFSMVTTRYAADQLYLEEKDKVMPSFWGSIGIMLVLGGISYGIFLINAGIPLIYQVVCLILFSELIVVWTEMNYLTAIKDYQGIMYTFVIALLFAWLIGYGFVSLGVEVVTALMLAVCVAYGIMACWYYFLLIGYFPTGRCSSIYFLKWFDKYPELSGIGIFIGIGLFGHFVIMWTGPVGMQIVGLFYGAPSYDTPALLAFLSILITTINFVTSVEVNFYDKYKNYFAMFNDGGSIQDIEQAEREMKSCLRRELTYTFTKQLFVTIVFVVLGTILLPGLPLGLNENTLGIFRILCMGYAFYAIGNCMMLMQLYFSDNKGALISSGAFGIISVAGTYLTKDWGIKYYGIGFLLGGIAFAIVSMLLLWRYIRNIMYHVLSNQPLLYQEKSGILGRIADKCQLRYEMKYERESTGKKQEERKI